MLRLTTVHWGRVRLCAGLGPGWLCDPVMVVASSTGQCRVQQASDTQDQGPKASLAPGCFAHG